MDGEGSLPDNYGARYDCPGTTVTERDRQTALTWGGSEELQTSKKMML